MIKFASGGFAGLVGSIFSAPADIIKVRMQAIDQYKANHGLIWHSQEIYRNWGFKGFFTGVQLTITRAIVLNAVLLSTYDHFKHFILRYDLLKDG